MIPKNAYLREKRREVSKRSHGFFRGIRQCSESMTTRKIPLLMTNCDLAAKRFSAEMAIGDTVFLRRTKGKAAYPVS